MSALPVGTIAWILALTLVSGIGDSQGFVHASEIWRDGRPSMEALLKSAGGFAIGIGAYWFSLRFMRQAGIVSPELQTMIWLVATLLGVALTSRKILQWQPAEQGVMLAVAIGIVWLVTRVK